MAPYLENKTLHATAPRDFFIKNQGLALQRTAARSPNVLLLYGSSELVDPIPNRASDFFSNAPSGFQVCPVGKAGTTSLVILQKLAALGPELRGRKVAISLSPSWFFTPTLDPYAYAGNFSLPVASGVLFGTALDFDLKAEIAKRMLQFPDTLAKSALLQLAASRLASGRPLDRLIFTALWPLGRVQNAVYDLQDHFETLIYILAEVKGTTRRASRFVSTDQRPVENSQENGRIESRGPTSAAADEEFRARIATASEWVDLDLLFRTLTKLEVRPLILSMPIDIRFHKTKGVSRLGRQIYYDMTRQLAQRYDFPLIQFEDHDGDLSFLIPHHEHPSPRGWMSYDEALDDFFHKAPGIQRERSSAK
jgi:D-alanine transfer protein